jgi:hypothetical protein
MQDLVGSIRNPNLGFPKDAVLPTYGGHHWNEHDVGGKRRRRQKEDRR